MSVSRVMPFPEERASWAFAFFQSPDQKVDVSLGSFVIGGDLFGRELISAT
jgi:hypothetical protein